MKRLIPAALVAALAVWWVSATPPEHLQVGEAVRFGGETAKLIAAVDRSEEFAASLVIFHSELPGHDDIVFLREDLALVSAVDGWIWSLNPKTLDAERLVDVPLMPAGMHAAPGDPDSVYFCSSRLYGEEYPADEAVGLYRLRVSSGAVEPVVLRVPDTAIVAAVVYPDTDTSAPQLRRADSTGGRDLAFCNDLEISADGRRIYFTEPFSYPGASMGGGAIPEAVTLGRNGRVWRHDLDTGTTRLIAEGFHFPDGILHDLHRGRDRESSIIVSQTPLFRLTRFHLAGSRAGEAEVVLDGLTGMCDGMDRDSDGRIWCALLTERSRLIEWLHARPWAKHLFLRLPLTRFPNLGNTGVLVLSPDGGQPLYSAEYGGSRARHVASAVPGPGGVYLTPVSHDHQGVVRLPHPLEN